MHGDGAVAGALVEALGGGLGALHVGDILLPHLRHRLHFAQVVVGVHMPHARHHAIDSIIDEPDRLGIELAGVVEGHHRLFLFLGGLFNRSGTIFLCRRCLFLGFCRLALCCGFLLLGFCRCFRCFRALTGGIGSLFHGFAHRVCSLRPALHPGAQDLHLSAGKLPCYAGLRQRAVKFSKLLFGFEACRDVVKGLTDELGAIHPFFFRRLHRLNKAVKALPCITADAFADGGDVHPDFSECLRGFAGGVPGAASDVFYFGFGQACPFAHFAQGFDERLYFRRAVHVFQRGLKDGSHFVCVRPEADGGLAKVFERLRRCLADTSLHLLYFQPQGFKGVGGVIQRLRQFFRTCFHSIGKRFEIDFDVQTAARQVSQFVLHLS